MSSQLSLEEKLEQYYIYKSDENYTEAISLSFDIVSHFISEGKVDSAETFFDKIIELADRSGDPLAKAEAAGGKGELLFMLEKDYQAINYFRIGNDYYKSVDSLTSHGHVDVQMGIAFTHTGQLDSAKFYLERGLATNLKINARKQIPLAYNGLALLYNDLGDAEKAFEMYINALSILEENKDIAQLAGLTHNLSDYFIRQNEWDKAEEYAQQSLDYANKANLVYTRIRSLQQLSFIQAEKGEWEAALKNYDIVLDYFEKKNREKRMANVYQQIGQIYQKQNQFEAALINYQKAAQIYEEGNDPLKIININVQIANIFLELDRVREAATLLEEGKRLALEVKSNPEKSKVFKALTELYSNMGNYKLALNHHIAYKQVADTLYNIEKAQIIKDMEAKYEHEKNINRISELNQNAQIRANQLKQQRLLIIALIPGLILLFGTSLFFYRNLQKNKLIAEQKEEISRQKIKGLEQENKMIALQSMIDGQDQERKRIAQDLHDGLGGMIATLKLQFSGSKAAKVNEGYEKGIEMLDMASKEVRKISHNLMPITISKFGLTTAIQDMCYAIENATDINATFNALNWKEDTLTENQAINLYRIVQELLNNIVKYAHATEVLVQISHRAGEIYLTVEDNGKGFNPNDSEYQGGLGLKNIASRITYLNGEMDIDSAPEKGTTVNIVFEI